MEAKLNRKMAADVHRNADKIKDPGFERVEEYTRSKILQIMPIKLPLSYDPGPLERVMHLF